MTINAIEVRTDTVRTHVHERAGDEPVVFVHGNVSDGDVWLEQLRMLPARYRGVALDLRGYGRTERRPANASRGVGDFADDLDALTRALDIGPAHLVGHSTGAGVILRYATDHPDRVLSLSLVAPVSLFGFGGTRLDGSPCSDDYAGSGGGAANPEFVRRLAEGDRSDDDPASPRNVIRGVFFPDAASIRDEHGILESMLRAEVGDDYYPGETRSSDNWPGFAPGTRGILNALSPRHLDLSSFASAGLRAPVLWVRGGKDAVISDTSLLDVGYLGQLEVVPGWPGAEQHPPQPMVGQMRRLLDAYASAGGSYTEEELTEAGHFVFTQCPEEFADLLHAHLDAAARR